MANYIKTYFAYNIGGAGQVVGAGATVNPTIQISGGDFVVIKMQGRVTTANNNIIQISDSITNRNWFLQPVIVDELLGAPGLPHVLPIARYLPDKCVLTFTITNIAGGDTVWLSLHGYERVLSKQLPSKA
jgi:hypothetical protein